MKNKLSYIYYGICLAIDIPAAVLAFLGIITFILLDKKDNVILTAVLFLFPALLTAANIIGIIRVRKKKPNQVPISLFMKLIIFLFCFGALYLTPPMRVIAAFLSFSLIGAFLAVLAVLLIRSINAPKTNPVLSRSAYSFQGGSGVRPFEGYVARKYHDNVLRELPQDSSPDERTVCVYASMPFIYLFQWLLDREYMSDEFYENNPKEDILDKLKYQSPLEIFGENMDYCLVPEDLRSDIKEFFDYYCVDTGVYSLKSVNYIFDYYDEISNPDNRFYTVDYSYESYGRLAKVFDQRLARFRGLAKAEKRQRHKTSDTVFWKMCNKTLGVAVCGEVSDDYVRKCEESLNRIDDEQWRRLERRIGADYRFVFTVKDLMVDQIVIFAPKGEEAAFVLCLSKNEEGRHSFYVSVRDGIVFEYGMDDGFKDTWSPEIYDVYQAAKQDNGLYHVSDEAELNRRISCGELTASKLGEDEFYVTPAAEEQIEKFRKRVEALSCVKGKMSVLHRYSRSAGNPVPNTVFVNAKADEKMVFSDFICVWH